jgi:hypothetical protein
MSNSSTSFASSVPTSTMTSAFGMGYLNAAQIIIVAIREITAHSTNVGANPVRGMNHPKNAMRGIDTSIMRVGCNEYIEFLMRFGTTSIMTRWVRIPAIPPNRFREMNSKNIRTTGTKVCTGTCISGRFVKGIIRLTNLAVSGSTPGKK